MSIAMGFSSIYALIDQSADRARTRNPPSSSNPGYFSPQRAFYTTPVDQSTPGVNLFTSNPLIQNVVEQGMRDFAGRTANMLPDGVNSIHSFFEHSMDCI